MGSAPHTADSGPPTGRYYGEVQRSAEFGELRHAHRSFAFPLTLAFIVWYFLYVLLSNYAGGLMGTKVFGNINVALVFGVAQFLTTFGIAWWYSRHAAAKIDPRAEAIKKRLDLTRPRRQDEVGKTRSPQDEVGKTRSEGDA